MSQHKQKKKRKAITLKLAIQRLDATIARVEENVKIALWAKAAFDSANTIAALNRRREWTGARTYNNLIRSLTLELALVLARLYDPGAKRIPFNKRDIASIPSMVRLLKQRRCQKVLLDRAKIRSGGNSSQQAAGMKGCILVLNAAIVVYEGWEGNRRRAAMVRKLRNFRNYRLAHSMMDDMLKSLPTYEEIFHLMENAREIAEHAKLAIAGDNIGLKHLEDDHRADADAFWAPALAR